MSAHFDTWRQTNGPILKTLQAGLHPKEVINQLSEGLLAHYKGMPLIDAYDVYQHLMDYWAETLQDDCYLIAADGWKAETARIIGEGQQGQRKGQGLDVRTHPQSPHRRPLPTPRSRPPSIS